MPNLGSEPNISARSKLAWSSTAYVPRSSTGKVLTRSQRKVMWVRRVLRNGRARPAQVEQVRIALLKRRAQHPQTITAVARPSRCSRWEAGSDRFVARGMRSLVPRRLTVTARPRIVIVRLFLVEPPMLCLLLLALNTRAALVLSSQPSRTQPPAQWVRASTTGLPLFVVTAPRSG